MDVGKVQVVLDWPKPANVKQLKGFLRLTGYYRWFIKAYATLAGPLTDLLKKEALCWTNATEQAFIKLKHAITSTPVLALPDFTQPFVLETDEFEIGVEAVLSQNGHPIAYFSKKLLPRMQKQFAYTREFIHCNSSIG